MNHKESKEYIGKDADDGLFPHLKKETRSDTHVLLDSKHIPIHNWFKSNSSK